MIPDQNTTGFSVTRLNGFSCFGLSPSPPNAESERRIENSGMIRSTIWAVSTPSAHFRKKKPSGSGNL